MLSTLAINSVFVALVAAAPIGTYVKSPEYVFGGSSLSSATFRNLTAESYSVAKGSCGWTNTSTDYVVSIKTNRTVVTDVCGMLVNVTNLDNSKWVVAQIVDECYDCVADYLRLSPAALKYVSEKPEFSAAYTFTNYSTEHAPYPTPSSEYLAIPSSKEVKKPWTLSKVGHSTESYFKKETSSASASSSKETSSSSKETASSSKETASSSKEKDSSSQPEHTFTSFKSAHSLATIHNPSTSSHKDESSTSKDESSTSAKYTPSTSATQAAATTKASSGEYSGEATWFTQDDNAGACGTVHADSDYVVALDSAFYGNGGYCGRGVTITNTANGKTVSATVADECPGCSSEYSLDLSVGAFEAIGDLNDGEYPISWSFT